MVMNFIRKSFRTYFDTLPYERIIVFHKSHKIPVAKAQITKEAECLMV